MLAVFVYFILPAILLILGLPIFLVLLVTCLVFGAVNGFATGVLGANPVIVTLATTTG